MRPRHVRLYWPYVGHFKLLQMAASCTPLYMVALKLPRQQAACGRREIRFEQGYVNNDVVTTIHADCLIILRDKPFCASLRFVSSF